MNPSSVWEDIGPFRALVDPSQRSPELGIALAHFSARLNQGLVEVLREEPVRSIRLRLAVGRTERDIVAQVFPEERIGRKRERAESLAAQSYLAASSLIGLGVGVPSPLACLERRAGPRVLGSYFLTEHVEGATSFDRELCRLFDEEPDFATTAAVITQVALALRNMHGLGVFHRALSNRCVVLGPPTANRPRRVMYVDLFRARLGRSPSVSEVAYDIACLDLPPRLRRVFFDAYWGGSPPRAFEHWERVFRTAQRLAGRTPCASRLGCQAKPPSRLPAIREQWLWDRSAHTAVNMARDPVRPPERRGSRLSVYSQLIAPQVYANAFGEPRSLEHVLAAGIRARPDTLSGELALLGELGVRDVMVRLCHHDAQESRRHVLAAIQKMAHAGFHVSGALVQDRRAVRDPALWTHFVNQILGHVGWQLQRVEFGHAVNLPAWGVRSEGDYRGLLDTLPELQNAYPGVAFAGPGIDGFDYRFARQALAALPAGSRWDAFAARIDGGPAWDGLSDDGLLRRCAGLVAEIRYKGNCPPHLILSEMSRVGRPVAGEDAEAEAARLVRRILLLTCAGMVDQTVLWWLSDVAGGGSGDPVVQSLVRLRALLGGGRFVRRLRAGDARRIFLLHCETVAAQPVLVGWVDGPPVQVEVPFPVSAAMDIRGRTAPLLPYPRLRLTNTPVYFHGS
jgi:hypothetical protein